MADKKVEEFFTNLEPYSHQDLVKAFNRENEKNPSSSSCHWIIKNEIKPVDLYCYLHAKFGPPNGVLTICRSEDSDNLIQWDWMLKTKLGTLWIQGHNFRTEVFITHEMKTENFTVDVFIDHLKSDFKNHGKDISNIKKSLEKWTEFVNPFFRIKATINQHFTKLEELKLDISEDKISNIFDLDDPQKWSEITNKYHFAVGLIYGLRSMLPVMAESFINCLIFLLCKPEIKNNQRMYDSTIRQAIDIRIQSLHLNCNYFVSQIDYTSDECKRFHTLMNERNDMLHGNINIQKQSFGEVYFNKNMAIYDNYQDHWEKSIGILIKSVKFNTIYEEKKVVDDFMQYVMSKIDPRLYKELEIILNESFLGFNPKTGRIGILFPSHFADFKVVNKDSKNFNG